MKRNILFILLILACNCFIYRQFVFCSISQIHVDELSDKLDNFFHFNRLNYIYKGQTIRFKEANLLSYKYHHPHIKSCMCNKLEMKTEGVGKEDIYIKFCFDNTILIKSTGKCKRIKVRELDHYLCSYLPNYNVKPNPILPKFVGISFTDGKDTLLLFRQSIMKDYGESRDGVMIFPHTGSRILKSGKRDRRFLENVSDTTNYFINFFIR